MTSDPALFAELDTLIRRAVHEAVAAALDRNADPRLGPFCGAVTRFLRDDTWTAAEIINDAARCEYTPLLSILDGIVGESGDPAKKLGRWLAAQAGRSADGLRLVRVARSGGVNLFVVQPVE